MRPAGKKCRRYRRAVALLAAILAGASTIHAQTPAPHLEVATVRPSDPAKEHLGLYWRQPDGFKCEGTTLRGLISNAYVVTGSSVKGLIVGGPAWMASQAFDVQVKVDPPTAARWSTLSQQAVDEERRSVLRELLAERFQLKLHREPREMPAYALTVVKGGSKLQPPVEETNLSADVPKSRINFYGRGHMQGHFATLGNLSGSLAGEPEIAGRPVVDKTGLTGQYDFTLHWAPFDPDPAAAPTDPGEQGPSLFTALEEQLGLKLKSEKEQVEVIVVDSVEKPSEN
ncbi:MAG TPA: TIGR03435 family protein [Edaphobacter sp.]|nr:TIGR03435 family protein [Edaphobacter sp.]